MKLYGLAGILLLVSVFLMSQMPAGRFNSTELIYPVGMSICILLAVFCIAMEVFKLTLNRRNSLGLTEADVGVKNAKSMT